MKNWKTSLVGVIAGLPTILGMMGLAIPEPVSKLILAIGVVVGMVLAKDNSVSGTGM